MTNWIPVTESLPCEFADVWVWDGQLAQMAHLEGDGQWWEFGDDEWVVLGVTHWQPIQEPEPPQ